MTAPVHSTSTCRSPIAATARSECRTRSPDGQRLFVTTDRLSAFDRDHRRRAVQGPGAQPARRLVVRATPPTSSPTTSSTLPDPNVLVARAAQPLPVEVIVRGYITGVTVTSLWSQYADGARTIYGYHFPDGLQKNTELRRPIITPTTKAEHGGHDEPLTVRRRHRQGPRRCRRCGQRCRPPRSRCSPAARRSPRDAGLILADTKYEFGRLPPASCC